MPSFLSNAVTVILVGAGAFLLFAAVLSFWKFERLMQMARAAEGERPLPPRDAFLVRIAARLAVGVRSGPFAVAVLEPAGAGPAPADLSDRLAAGLRRNRDEVLALEGGRFGLVVAAPAAGALGAFARLQPALPVPLRIGAAAFPESGETAAALLEAAEEALEAEAGPGLRARPENLLSPEPAEEEPPPGEMIDPVTGILRRDRLDSAARKFIARALRGHPSVAVLWLDLAGIERVNAQYGRPAGDALLRRLGETLNRCVRETDLIGRTDGSGAVAVLVCGADEALRVARRLIAEVIDVPVEVGASRVRAAANAGLAVGPDHGVTWSALSANAGRALQRSRRDGRNRAALFDPATAQRPRRAAQATDQDVF